MKSWSVTKSLPDATHVKDVMYGEREDRLELLLSPLAPGIYYQLSARQPTHSLRSHKLTHQSPLGSKRRGVTLHRDTGSETLSGHRVDLN